MRIFVLIALICALFTTSLVNAAHADVVDTACIHHTVDAPDAGGNCADDGGQDHADLGFCDCCCHHAHVMAPLHAPDMAGMPFTQRLMPGLDDILASRDVPSPYKPPIT